MEAAIATFYNQDYWFRSLFVLSRVLISVMMLQVKSGRTALCIMRIMAEDKHEQN